MILADVKLEVEIEAARWQLAHATTDTGQQLWWNRMAALLAKRRPEFVAELERMKGLKA